MNRSLNVGGIPFNVTLHSWPVPRPANPKNSIGEYDDLRNGSVKLHNFNATGYFAIEDEIVDDLSDAQTLLLTGLATLIVLAVAVATVFGLLTLWNRLHHNVKTKEIKRDARTDNISSEAERPHNLQLPQEIKTSESLFTSVSSDDQQLMTPTAQTPKSNGSVITMTLKNNHLIVETEEALDVPTSIRVESCGTTTTYITPNAPDFSGNDKLSNNFGALIHEPPKEVENKKKSSQTGLTQSDLSVASNENENPTYRYGNQISYGLGGLGYPESTGYECETTLDDISRSGKSNRTRSPSIDNYLRKCSSASGYDDKNLPISTLLCDEQEKKLQEEQRALGQGTEFPEVLKKEQGLS